MADDFTSWLGILKLSGAIRLSLHPLSQFTIAPLPALYGDGYAVAVHYSNYCQLWITGHERPLWHDHPILSTETSNTFALFPDATRYSGDLDSYWSIEGNEKSICVPDTEWLVLAANIAADLDISCPAPHKEYGPFSLPTSTLPTSNDWARMPLFPYVESAGIAHAILATLDAERSKFSNDMNPKNENSIDKSIGGKMDLWGKRLDSWIVEVSLRCANQCNASFSEGKISGQRVYTSEPLRSDETKETAVDQASEQMPIPELPLPVPKVLHALGALVGIAACSLFILAVANIIVSWPWLAVLIGLPCALVLKLIKRA